MFRPIPQLTRFGNLDRHKLASQSLMTEFSGPGVPQPYSVRLVRVVRPFDGITDRSDDHLFSNPVDR